MGLPASCLTGQKSKKNVYAYIMRPVIVWIRWWRISVRKICGLGMSPLLQLVYKRIWHPFQLSICPIYFFFKK